MKAKSLLLIFSSVAEASTRAPAVDLCALERSAVLMREGEAAGPPPIELEAAVQWPDAGESFFHDVVERHRGAAVVREPQGQREVLAAQKPRSASLFIAGNLAGVTCAALSHPLNVTKYSFWNGMDQGFVGTVRRLYLQGGPRTLYRGLVATLARDSLFGGVYSCLRHHLICSWGSASPRLQSSSSSAGGLMDSFSASSKEGKTDSIAALLLNGFALNTVAAGIAVAVSSPLNYVRNMQLAAPPEAAVPRMLPLLRQLRHEAAEAKGRSARLEVLSRSLLVGWGSLRAAMGMGFGSFVYDWCKGRAAL
ncbi:hypothetical protein Efla_005634 [Eimeria flavescens]